MSLDKSASFWAGNLFLASDSRLMLTPVLYGTERAFLEIHNPTKEEIRAKIYSPANTPKFGGMSFEISVPAGDSVRCDVKDKLIL